MRIAVLGLGMAVQPHARSLVELQENGRVEVLGCWSRSAERRTTFAERYGLPVTSDLDTLIAHPDLDAALLLTPPDAREELVTRLAQTGKHILAEKPVERTTAAALRIVTTCEKAGITLGTVFQFRFRQSSEALRRLLDQGALGEIVAVELTVPWWRPQSYYDSPGRGTLARDGGDVLLTQAIHSLDLMLSLTPPVTDVSAVAGTSRIHRMETEDLVAGGLVFANGALGGLFATTAAYPGDPERLSVAGTLGRATLASGVLDVRYLDGRTEQVGEPAATGGGADPMAFPHAWHKSVISDFVQAVQDRRPPRIPGRQALRVHHLIDALLLSAREGRRVPVEVG